MIDNEAGASRVDVRFVAADDGKATEAVIVHRDFPRHGDGWEAYKSQDVGEGRLAPPSWTPAKGLGRARCDGELDPEPAVEMAGDLALDPPVVASVDHDGFPNGALLPRQQADTVRRHIDDRAGVFTAVASSSRAGSITRLRGCSRRS